jgi:lauroyl/myristoyl acyltransferase
LSTAPSLGLIDALPASGRQTSYRAIGMKQHIRPRREANAHCSPSTRITIGDLAAVVKLLSLGIVSWLVPVDWLSAVSRCIGRGTALWHGDTSPTERFVCAIGAARDLPEVTPDIHKRYQDHLREVRLVILALNRPGRRWQPNVRLHGLDHLRSAVARGSGAILWVSRFAHDHVIRMALHQAGFAVCVLSRPGHGFSESPFGIRWLNPLWTRIDRRFNTERVVIQKNDVRSALQVFRQRLGANRIVWITVGPEARRTLRVPFLGGTIRLPTGPLHLARISGAALLPVFPIRANDGSYDVTIEQPLDLESGPTDSRGHADVAHLDEYIIAPARAYVTMLEPYVTAHPDQWIGWETLMVAPTDVVS